MENRELENIELEIEELAMQLSDMLKAALYFAGVEKKHIDEAIDAYVETIDEVFEDDDDGEMGLDEIIKIINKMKENYPHLFKKR